MTARNVAAPALEGKSSPASATDSPRLPEATRDLEAIYREVDDEVRGSDVTCALRGVCCDFERSEHRLYATGLEVAHVREVHPEPLEGPAELCPFWKDGLCTERDRRPLGCRVYFCDPAYRARGEAIYERYHRRIREACERHGVAYTYAPFVRELRDGGEKP